MKQVRNSIDSLSFSSGFYFVSDQHFGHENIITYCDRPFANGDEMEEFLVERHNSVVGKDDPVLMLGDFIWGRKSKRDSVLPKMRELLRKLNGEKYLILGNHDYMQPEDYLNCGFLDVREEAVIDGITFVHSPKNVLLSCDAEFTDMPEGYSRIVLDGSSLDIEARFVCGHVHQMWKALSPFVNVSVDVWDYAPVHSDKVRDLLENLDRQPYAGIGGTLLPLLRDAGFDPDFSDSPAVPKSGGV